MNNVELVKLNMTRSMTDLVVFADLTNIGHIQNPAAEIHDKDDLYALKIYHTKLVAGEYARIFVIVDKDTDYMVAREELGEDTDRFKILNGARGEAKLLPKAFDKKLGGLRIVIIQAPVVNTPHTELPVDFTHMLLQGLPHEYNAAHSSDVNRKALWNHNEQDTRDDVQLEIWKAELEATDKYCFSGGPNGDCQIRTTVELMEYLGLTEKTIQWELKILQSSPYVGLKDAEFKAEWQESQRRSGQDDSESTFLKQMVTLSNISKGLLLRGKEMGSNANAAYVTSTALGFDVLPGAQDHTFAAIANTELEKLLDPHLAILQATLRDVDVKIASIESVTPKQSFNKYQNSIDYVKGRRHLYVALYHLWYRRAFILATAKTIKFFGDVAEFNSTGTAECFNYTCFHGARLSQIQQIGAAWSSDGVPTTRNYEQLQKTYEDMGCVSEGVVRILIQMNASTPIYDAKLVLVVQAIMSGKHGAIDAVRQMGWEESTQCLIKYVYDSVQEAEPPAALSRQTSAGAHLQGIISYLGSGPGFNYEDPSSTAARFNTDLSRQKSTA